MNKMPLLHGAFSRLHRANPMPVFLPALALYGGPAHGGPMRQLTCCMKSAMCLTLESILKRAKDPQDNFRLMGFGHRVYKNYDPRAKVMRETCHEVLDEVGKKEFTHFQAKPLNLKNSLGRSLFCREKALSEM